METNSIIPYAQTNIIESKIEDVIEMNTFACLFTPISESNSFDTYTYQ